MAKQESYLLFLRKTDTPEKPYYTLEVEPDGTVRQKRTYFDRQILTLRKQKILVKWQEQLVRKLNKEDKILSLKSRDLRKKKSKICGKRSKSEWIWIHWKAACGYSGRGFDGERRIKW